jgi:hypothetical protein
LTASQFITCPSSALIVPLMTRYPRPSPIPPIPERYHEQVLRNRLIPANGCGIRVYRGLFKCTTTNKVFNSDLIAARNILMTATSNNTSMAPVTPESRRGIGGNGRRPGQGLNPQERGDVAQTSLYQIGRRS